MKPAVLYSLLACLFFITTTKAQSLEQRLQQSRPSCREVFSNAMDLLPGLLTAGSYDSIAFVIEFIEKSCEKTSETFDLRVLMAIQSNKFSVPDFYTAPSFFNLQYRANANLLQNDNPYIADPLQTKFYRFTKNWATDLLNSNNLDKDEVLICKVFTGEVKSPNAFIKQNKTDYPYLFTLLEEAESIERNKPMAYISITGGFWVPTSKLKLVGAHPTVGLQFGYHHKANDFALTLQFKFIRSAHPYAVLRNTQLYDLTHFFGGYVGMDYTRLLYTGKTFEFGLMAGAGYDRFDIASGENNEHLKPFGIGSLNINTGIRLNYFYKTKKFIGIQGRYNVIDFKNEGGSNLSGDAITIDVLFGFNRGS
ncbi:MAG: hypothetical protein V4717_07610 [Bacteroidota bacterium]